MLKSLLNRLRSFRDRTDGSVSVEFILAMPIVFWAFMAVYVFFDGYRQSAINLKAAYTISDLISRETEAINDDYIDSMHSMFKLLTRATSITGLRISVIRWDAEDDRYYVEWSEDRGFGLALDDNAVQSLEDKLPVMPDEERVILVETRNTFVPLYNVGMENKQLENFVFTRPRFAPQVVFDNNA
jgi:hypothetical protein